MLDNEKKYLFSMRHSARSLNDLFMFHMELCYCLFNIGRWWFFNLVFWDVNDWTGSAILKSKLGITHMHSREGKMTKAISIETILRMERECLIKL